MTLIQTFANNIAVSLHASLYGPDYTTEEIEREMLMQMISHVRRQMMNARLPINCIMIAAFSCGFVLFNLINLRRSGRTVF